MFITSAAYIHMHIQNAFAMEVNTITPHQTAPQTAPTEAVCNWLILFAI